MVVEVDARGLSCPQPVIRTKKALEGIEEGTVMVLVDSAQSRENVRRFAQSRNCQVDIDERGQDFCLTITKGCPVKAEPIKSADIVMITSNQLGTGDEKFSESLMMGFINNLGEAARAPDRIIFINSGVRLTTEGSGVLETLKRLEQAGVQILSCGACLEYYQLTDRLRVGIVTNMYEVVASLLAAGKVIKI